MTYGLSGRLGVDLDQTSTTQVFPLGTQEQSNTGATLEYVRASAAVAQYAVVKIDDDNRIAELTTAISGSEPTRVGVAQVAFASGDYGWVVRKGACTVLTNAAVAADVKCYTTATAGKIDDDATGSDTIQGLKLTSAAGSATSATAFAAEFMTTNAES